MNLALAGLTWRPQQLGEAMQALARAARIEVSATDVRLPDAEWISSLDEFGDRLERLAAVLGADVDFVQGTYATVKDLLLSAGPAILWVDGELLLLLKARRHVLHVVAPDRNIRTVPLEDVRRALIRVEEDRAVQAVDRLLGDFGGRPSARAALIAEEIGEEPIGHCWLLRAPAGTAFLRQLASEGVLAHLAIYLSGHAMFQAIFLIGWWVVGQGALTDQLDTGRMTAWLLLLLSQVPLLMLTRWSAGRFSVGAGTLLKRRLQQGITRLTPEEVRGQGTGQFLGRVLESAAIEQLALGGGMATMVALIELCFTTLVLAGGAGALLQIPLFYGWLALVGWVAWRAYKHRVEWTESRLDITHALVERMVGQRTRLVQERPERWHVEEDSGLERYNEDAIRADRWSNLLVSAASRGWYVAGTTGLAWVFVTDPGDLIQVAVALGGLLLGARTIDRFVEGASQITGALIAWKQMKQLFEAGARVDGVPAQAILSGTDKLTDENNAQVPLISLHDVSFRYRPYGKAILDDVDLEIYRGDRVMLEGPSGGGKSTLVSILTGLRRPQSGVLLLEGLDYHAVGSTGWRQHVVAAPQFHENHIFSGPLSFNLLLGRGWPARPSDLEEAEEVCRVLGLGDLLDRMPAGLEQIVGETGWQLSHGERSRIYIARALLQRAQLVVLDESFGALDPFGLRQAMDAVIERSPALVVIAHP